VSFSRPSVSPPFNSFEALFTLKIPVQVEFFPTFLEQTEGGEGGARRTGG